MNEQAAAPYLKTLAGFVCETRIEDLPAEVIDKAPSADLFEGQTDEEELGFTYDEADRLLFLLVDERHDAAQLAERGFDPKLVEGVVRRIVNSQYKRIPPVVAKISDRTVNQDFRYLRSWGR